jgi:tagatose 6-phosphate kinase
LIAAVERHLPNASAVLVTGSLSRGLPVNFYRRILELANTRRIYAAIDATGPVLQEGLRGRPALLKSNIEEISSAIGPIGQEPREIADSLKRHRDALPANTVVTLGEKGAVLVCGSTAWYAVPPKISHANPIGAGDAFAAAFIKGHLEGRTAEDTLRFATAAAVSDAFTMEPGKIVPAEMTTLVLQTSVMQW